MLGTGWKVGGKDEARHARRKKEKKKGGHQLPDKRVLPVRRGGFILL